MLELTPDFKSSILLHLTLIHLSCVMPSVLLLSSIISVFGEQHGLLLPPCGENTNLQGTWMALWLPLAGLFDELAE